MGGDAQPQLVGVAGAFAGGTVGAAAGTDDMPAPRSAVATLLLVRGEARRVVGLTAAGRAGRVPTVGGRRLKVLADRADYVS
jgi:hypothetical protein